MLRVTIRQKHPNASYLLRFNSTMIEQSVKMFGLTDLVIVAFDPLRYKVTTAPLDKIH